MGDVDEETGRTPDHAEDGAQPDPARDDQVVARRRLLRGAAIAGAAVAAKVLGDGAPATASDGTPGQPLYAGPNVVREPTSLLYQASAGVTLDARGGSTGLLGAPLGEGGTGVVGLGPKAQLDAALPVPNVGVLGLGPGAALDPNDPRSSAGVFGVSNVAGDPNEPVSHAGVFGLSNVAGDPNQPTLHYGVFGISSTAGVPDPNMPMNHAGVYGVSVAGPGVAGESDGRFGVVGVRTVAAQDPNDPAIAGVYGFSPDAAGVSGRSDAGVGVRGLSMNPATPGVEAANVSPEGVGLRVRGRAAFSTRGSGIVPAGSAVAAVVDRAVRDASVVVVNLVGVTSTGPLDPGAQGVRAVLLTPGAGFTVQLDVPTPVDLRFNYLVLG